MNAALDHILAHLDEPLSLKKLARVAKFSPFHFHRVFQSLVGETPADFVQRVRLDKALTLLAREKRPALTKIALACGFASSSDFSRSFRRRFGAAPSAFDVDAWRATHRAEFEACTAASPFRIEKLPAPANPDEFEVKLVDLPARTVAYIRVLRPYRADAVPRAVEKLLKWAEARGIADHPWRGYQWENPEIVPLEHCRYHIAVEAEGFTPEGVIGKFRFPPMRVAQIEVRGSIDLELRALQHLYGSWLPRSGYVPDDHPAFEAFIGRPLAHGFSYFELYAQLPVRR